VAQLTQQLVEVQVVVKVQVMDLEHQQLENQEDQVVVEEHLMELLDVELQVKVIMVELEYHLQAIMTMVVVAAEKLLSVLIHQELLEELVEQEQILVHPFQEQQTALHTVVAVAEVVEEHHLDLLEELVAVVEVDHNQQELEQLELQTLAVVEVVQ
tara:strand:+ start:314 stop:781 length:468 start_codon:yes stop_codon:yes gene_type:complete